MPSSSEETQPSSVNTPNTSKQAQEPSPSSGVTIPTKKGRRNGATKDAGGSPAVMKQASKMPDSSKPSSISMAARFSSSDTAPVAVGSNGITSPLLEALSSNAFTNSTAQNTNDWARNVPVFSSSPGNLISLSDSPPTQPSSYDDRSTLIGWNNHDRNIHNTHLSSASPPNNRRRPLSFQMEGHPGFEDAGAKKQPYLYRRSSMYSQQSHQAQRYPMNPPLPHQPQSHFYGAPDLNLGLPYQTSGLKPGSNGYHCSIDSVNVAGVGPLKQIDSLVISGYEGGVDIYGISKGGVDKIFNIDTLRGGVYGAKVLPWTMQGGIRLGYPLIAVVLHSPLLPDEASDSVPVTQAAADSSLNQRTESVHGSPKEFSASPQLDSTDTSITHYQTTVEVFSLSTKKHVKTLLSLPRVPLVPLFNTSGFASPPPVGALQITADGGYILITSGTSGEVWIYHQVDLESELSVDFHCLGKVWTSVHHVTPKESANPSEFSDGRNRFSESPRASLHHRTPLLSLTGRWLAYCPSRATSQISLRAMVPGQTSASKLPGLTSYVPPQLPTVNCAVDMPEDEQLLKRVAREAAQMAYDGAKWVSNQGYQVVKNYWNKSTNNAQTNGPSTGGQAWSGTHQAQGDASHTFPPTHGETLHNTSSAEPSLISILDLQKLVTFRSTSSSSLPHPISTFKAPFGCSFISFAPNGLMLFTASSDGKLQFVWDLMRIQYTKSSVLQAPHLASLQSQHVRQVAVFTRMSPCDIIDVVWTVPHGERTAVLTANNTTHFYNMPSSAFAWPPLRRRINSAQPKSPGISDAGDGMISTSLTNKAWSYAPALWPLNSGRSRGMSGPGISGISAAAVTAQGGKALASGISKSFGAASETFERYYKSGDNKLHGNTSGAIIRSAKWTRAQEKDSLSCLLDGTANVMINTYRIKQRKSKSKGGRFHLYIGSHPLSYTLPSIPDRSIAPVVMRAMNLEDDPDSDENGKEGYEWHELSSAVKADMSATESSIPQAEIESNAPYQPFHTDRRVALYVYSTQIQDSVLPSVSTLLNPVSTTTLDVPLSSGEAPWVFGMPISAVKLDIGHSQVNEEDGDSTEDHRALPTSAMERVTTKFSEVDEDSEQIVVTTRRRKGASRTHTSLETGLDDDGFFEDDCEVLDFASQRV